MTRVLALGALGVLLCACGERSTPAPMPSIASVSLDDLEPGPVHGTLDGEPFRAVDARFRVVTRSERQRVDLIFSDAAIERCGLPVSRDDRRVWLRFTGRTRVEPGTYTLAGSDGDGHADGDREADFDVHYERPNGRRFVSVHRGVARVEVREVTSARVSGVLDVCFADTAQSCVEGSFVATPCLSRIDGRALREPPGLSDDAIDAVGRGAE